MRQGSIQIDQLDLVLIIAVIFIFADRFGEIEFGFEILIFLFLVPFIEVFDTAASTDDPSDQ
jgi:hypothetical protein